MYRHIEIIHIIEQEGLFVTFMYIVMFVLLVSKLINNF